MTEFPRRDLDATMRWLRANGIEHTTEQILEDSLHVDSGRIHYEVWDFELHGRIPQVVTQRVTFHQANPPQETA